MGCVVFRYRDPCTPYTALHVSCVGVDFGFWILHATRTVSVPLPTQVLRCFLVFFIAMSSWQLELCTGAYVGLGSSGQLAIGRSTFGPSVFEGVSRDHAQVSLQVDNHPMVVPNGTNRTYWRPHGAKRWQRLKNKVPKTLDADDELRFGAEAKLSVRWLTDSVALDCNLKPGSVFEPDHGAAAADTSTQSHHDGKRRLPPDCSREDELPCYDPRREARGLPRRVSSCKRPCCIKTRRVVESEDEQEDLRGDSEQPLTGKPKMVTPLPKSDRPWEREQPAQGTKRPHQFAKQSEKKRQREAERNGIALADKWQPSDCLIGYVAMEKYDGYRAIWNPALDQRGYFTTRQGRHLTPPPSLAMLLPSDLVLDGELWAGRGQFQATSSVLNAQGSSHGEADESMWAKLVYVVYDAPGAPGSFCERLALAGAKLAHVPSERVLVAPTWPCEDTETKDRLLRDVLERGGEGLMLRRRSSMFHRGVSPNRDLLKVKPFADAEALIIPPDPKRSSKNSVRVRCLNGEAAGKEFYISTVDPTTKPPGTVVTFRYQHGLEGGMPRHAFIDKRHPPSCACITCETRRDESNKRCARTA